MKTTRISLITDHLKLERYSMSDFWVCCPFELEEFQPDERTAEIRAWRQVGMVWGRLCGMSQKASGRFFFRDHATCLHSEKIVLDSLIDYRRGCVQVHKAIKTILEHTKTAPEKHSEQHVNELISLVSLQSQISKS